MKRSKRAYKYIKEEIESQQITLKKVKIIDTVSEYATIDRIDGMLSLASEIGLMSDKKIKKLNILKMENEKKISKHEKYDGTCSIFLFWVKNLMSPNIHYCLIKNKVVRSTSPPCSFSSNSAFRKCKV